MLTYIIIFILYIYIYISSSYFHLHYFAFITFAKRFDKGTARCTEIISNPYTQSQSFEFLQSTRSLKTKKKRRWVALCKLCFTVWLPRNGGKNQRNFGFNSFFFFLGFCIEFLIELLKKIEALLFFEIELVCGIGLCFWVLFDFWKDWISDWIFVYMLVYFMTVC